MKEMYEEMMRLGGILEENGINVVKRKAPAKAEDIEQWEKSNGVVLPKEYKEFVLLANGIHYRTTSLYSLKQIEKDELQFKGYYVIGEYIGDGSLLLCDDNGTVYTGDHAAGIEQVDFREFLEEWMLRCLKEDLEDNGITNYEANDPEKPLDSGKERETTKDF